MKIALDAKRAFHNHRGLGNYSRDVIRLLREYAPKNEYLLFAKPTERYSFPKTTIVAPQGCWKYISSLWRSLGCIKQLKGIDLYWGLSGELPFGIEKTGAKSVVTIHDTIFLRYPELYSSTYRWLFTRKMRYAIQVADTIIAISEQTKRDIIEYFGADESKIKVVYQGCNNRFREPITEQEVDTIKKKYNLPDKYLVDVGALEPRKNIKALIRAMALAKIELPLIAVGGKSKYGDEAQALANELGVQMIQINRLPFEELPALYKGAIASIYPSVFEGFGIPILESMCVGTPVLTSTGSCFAETGGDAAQYANPSDVEDIAAKLSQLISDEALRKEMIQKGYKQADKFTDEKVATNIIKSICLNK